jgi:hypothetical protein
MNKVDLSSLLKETTYLVNVYLGKEMELISSGSAVPINENGVLVTAAHVVTGRLPVKKEDVHDPEATILVKSIGGVFQEYHSGTCGFSMSSEYFREPIFVDLAILIPNRIQNKIKHLPITSQEIETGQDVIMAGYPDDIELPFSFDRHLDMKHPQNKGVKKHIEIAKRLLMVKSGMIGHKSSIFFSGSNMENPISGEVMYIDNVMHSGASGGPVINYHGELVGVIVQRAITSVSYEETPSLKVPSGSTLALSPKLIQSLI